MNFYDKFRVKSSDGKVNLKKISPDEKDHGWQGDEDRLEKELKKNTKKLFDLQYKLYAENRQSLLIVLQALDAGGKDGTINHVLSAMNPQGCRAQSFKIPTPIEASHDFLWREHRVAPHDGEVVIFNRSHYEDVLVGRVHGGVKGNTLKQHMEYINDFEKLLKNNNTTIVKFFLHISKEEQLERFGSRLEDPAKHWKISEGDYKEREFWDDYMKAFQDVFNNCSPDHAPWFIIPANNKKFRNLAISEILVKTMRSMNPKIPPATINVDEIRKLYHEDVLEQEKANGSEDSPCKSKKSKKDKKDKKGKRNKK